MTDELRQYDEPLCLTVNRRYFFIGGQPAPFKGFVTDTAIIRASHALETVPAIMIKL